QGVVRRARHGVSNGPAPEVEQGRILRNATMAASVTLSRYMDALHTRAEQAMFVAGTRVKLPWPALRAASRAAGVMRRPVDTLRRRLLASQVASRAKAMGVQVPR